MRISHFLKNSELNQKTRIEGWVKSFQVHGKDLVFISLNDGSTCKDLQIVCKTGIDTSLLTVGSAISASGFLQKSPKGGQDLEFVADGVEILSSADQKFPIQKKEHGFEFLREVSHQRARTRLFRIVNAIKNEVNYSIHEFFYSHGFTWIQAPILTSNNCEGGSEVFEIKNSENSFKKTTLLSVSGQFHAEAMALGLKDVYTFGPTFRAEKSNTSQHLSEFWMIEPECSFSNLDGNINLMEDFLKFVVNRVLRNCHEELEFLADKLPNNEDLIPRLENLLSEPFGRISYREAIDMLLQEQKKGVTFENNDIKFGIDLASEHERYITSKFKKAVFITHYPRAIKAFYMKDCEDETVLAVDLLVPEVGELMGGSERESDFEKLRIKAEEFGIPLDHLNWYLELRKYGYYSSAGFGCGYERLIMYLTGMKNIKDIINYPRSYGQLNF
ncbi:asparaginyl-tRNA synthetase [Mycoplasma haemofelis str. Langford 1]|uniref:Asparagine--tRNA ligase n=1 Tax=Mycoplasma haemofelis (strain Langford 1) TaxID=941640 RepID=E8ZKC3_MYCHL|nr:asparagine--tRNA ligase [Mycoplasma haemofelis]CBY92089.1 asparaginyl-tRNA synthetase [Mycoplasma haemofelis str. Langford 1]